MADKSAVEDTIQEFKSTIQKQTKALALAGYSLQEIKEILSEALTKINASLLH